MARILIIEDEDGLAGAIRDWLVDEYYVVKAVGDGLSGLKELQSDSYEAAILDLMLPGLDGLEVCKRYRSGGGRTAILMLTAKSSISAKETGLDSGADDYLTKPFHLRELSARIRALLRRPQSTPVQSLRAGDINLEVNSRTVTRDGAPIRLLPKEFTLLEVLLRHAGQVLSAERLIEHLWSGDADITQDTVRSHMRSLRKKIDDRGGESIIKTVHGVGYKIEAD